MATKGAIAVKTAKAFDRISAAMQDISYLLGVDKVDLASIRHRDPAIRHQFQMEALADWCEAIAHGLGEQGVDMSGAKLISDQLGAIQWTLQQTLPAMTKRQLDTLADEIQVDVRGMKVKDEVIVAICEALTGDRIEIASMEDIVDAYNEDEDDEVVADIADIVEDIVDAYNEDEDDLD